MIRSSIPRIRKPAPPIQCHIPNVWHCILNTIEYKFELSEGMLTAKELELRERSFIGMLENHSMISPTERNILCDYISKCSERMCKMFELAREEETDDDQWECIADVIERFENESNQ